MSRSSTFRQQAASGLFLGLNEFAECPRLDTNIQYGVRRECSGGVIEAVTKSGSNHFHGSLFELSPGCFSRFENYFDFG